MSRQLVQRTFVKGGYYHIFNRGNNKKEIFCDQADYQYFLNLLDSYLLKNSIHRPEWILNDFLNQIELSAYCLMPNHFHILLQQKEKRAMADFMSGLLNRYTKYFNKKYNTVGHLFQGKYKARLIENDGDLLYISRYIHRNPEKISSRIEEYPYSSAQFYIGNKNAPQWLQSNQLLLLLTDIFGVEHTQAHSFYQKYLLH